MSSRQKILECLISAAQFGRLHPVVLLVGQSASELNSFVSDLLHKIAGIDVSKGHLDLLNVGVGGDERIKISEAQSIRQHLSVQPRCSYRIVHLHRPERMTHEAVNCLLKTFEEPPEKGLIIMTSLARHSVLQTIQSRSLTLRIPSLKRNREFNTQVRLYSGGLWNYQRLKSIGGLMKGVELTNVLDDIELELNAAYRAALQSFETQSITAFLRRERLSRLRQFAVRRRISLNSQLAVEGLYAVG